MTADRRNDDPEPAWLDLRRRLLDAIGRPGDRLEIGRRVWRLLAADPWYRGELAAAARRSLRRRHLPVSWRDDVEQDALVLLDRQLRSTPDLNYDRGRPEAEFPGWLGRVAENGCREAVRRLRRQYGRSVPLVDGDRLASAREARGRDDRRRADLARAIEGLSDPERGVLRHAREGRTFAEAGDALGLSPTQARRAYHRGVAALREWL